MNVTLQHERSTKRTEVYSTHDPTAPIKKLYIQRVNIDRDFGKVPAEVTVTVLVKVRKQTP